MLQSPHPELLTSGIMDDLPIAAFLSWVKPLELVSPELDSARVCPAQVISIVTAGSTTNKGLFFPKGLNGNIK